MALGLRFNANALPRLCLDHRIIFTIKGCIIDQYSIPSGKSLASKATARYLEWHVNRLFRGAANQSVSSKIEPVIKNGKVIERFN